ncbi:MAG: zinc-dependent alcohol dehydrogenase [Acetobacteraceae bacterium]
MTHSLFLRGPRDAVVAPSSLREGKPGETLLEVAAVGICGSDLHYYKDGGIGSAAIRKAFVPGHEFGGWLTEDLPKRGLRKGVLVAVDPSHPCGWCEQCGKGYPNLCPNVEFIGAPPHDGAMTERLWVRNDQIVPLPPGTTPLEAVMLEPLGVAIHAVGLAKPGLLERVTVLGAGPIGLLILQLLKIAGAGEISAVEPQAHRRGLASRLGATRATESLTALEESVGSGGTSLVVEATNASEGFRDAVRAACIGGRIVLVGIPDGDRYVLPASEARRRGLKVKFARRMGDVYPRAIQLVREKLVDVESLVTRRFALADAPEAFRLHAANTPGLVKSLIVPSPTVQ